MAKEWAEFAAAVVPETASANQITSMQDAFYAGALCLFGKLTDIGDRPFNPTQIEHDTEILEALFQEVKAYGDRRARELQG